MNTAELIIQADTLEAEAEAALSAASAAARIEGWLEPGASLKTCAESRRLKAKAAEVRRELARLGPVAVASSSTALLPTVAASIDAAIAAAMRPQDAAVSAVPTSALIAAPGTLGKDPVDAIAARIVASDRPDRSAAYLAEPNEVDLVARRIVSGATDIEQLDEVGAIARRIAAA